MKPEQPFRESAETYPQNSDVYKRQDIRDGKIRPSKTAIKQICVNTLVPHRYHRCTLVIQDERHLLSHTGDSISEDVIEELERCIVEGISDYEIVLCSNPIISLAKEILSYPNTTCKTSYSSISEESEWRSIPIEDLIEKLDSDYFVFIGKVAGTGDSYYEQLIQAVKKKRIDASYVVHHDIKYIRYEDDQEKLLTYPD